MNLFVYGSLMNPEIIHALTDRTFVMKDALLRGYGRYAKKPFLMEGLSGNGPVLLPDPQGSVMGKLLVDVDERSQKIFHLVEKEYQQEEVSVEVEGESFLAMVYLQQLPLDYPKGEWDLETFRKKHLSKYLQELIPLVKLNNPEVFN